VAKTIATFHVESSINEWHRRRELVVKNGHIEHCNLSWT